VSHTQRLPIPNHTIDPDTGFVESNAYISSFDAEKKKQFLSLFKSNGLGLYRTCRQLGMSVSTIHKHYQIDPEFKRQFDDVRQEYVDELEAMSRTNALNPKSVIERIFQLKALLPSKYGDQKSSAPTQINVNLSPDLVEIIKKREQVLEADVITSTPSLATESTVLSDSNGHDNTGK